MPKCFRFLSGVCIGLSALVMTAQTALADPQAFHIVNINEVYTNADGTRQFVELISGSPGQNALAPTWLIAINANGTDTNVVFDFTGNFLPSFNTNEIILLATLGLQADLGIVADFTIPDNSIFLTNGRVVFEDPPPFQQHIDAVAYGAYTGPNDLALWGSPTAALPSNGCSSLRRNITDYALPKNNALQWGVAANATPRNHDGDTQTITCPPAAPVLAAIGNKSTTEQQLLTFGITATDANGDVIILSAQNLPSGAGFVNHGNGTGTFTWQTNCASSGVYPGVLFIASDGALADSESISITVNELSNPAIARDSAATVIEDGQVLANLQGYDPDGNPVTYAIISGPTFGDATGLNPSTGAFTYEPNPNSNTPDAIQFTITDNNCQADTGMWTVTVTPVNDAPVANNVAAGTSPNTPVAIGAMPATDIDGPTLAFSHVAGPFHGSTDNLNTSNGAFDYTPGLDYEGADTVFYAASDGSFADTALVIITITSGCVCDCHADPACDGSTDVLDVVGVVNVAFRGASDVVDPQCTHVGRTDNNCDCATDVLDVVGIVNRAFRGDQTPFCDACTSPCP